MTTDYPKEYPIFRLTASTHIFKQHISMLNRREKEVYKSIIPYAIKEYSAIEIYDTLDSIILNIGNSPLSYDRYLVKEHTTFIRTIHKKPEIYPLRIFLQ